MTEEINGDTILQIAVTRDKDPPHSMRIRIDAEPASKRELMNAMAFLAERSDIAARYLIKGILVEELR
jgi:hypothetical protein